jgi:hypothetical protein
MTYSYLGILDSQGLTALSGTVRMGSAGRMAVPAFPALLAARVAQASKIQVGLMPTLPLAGAVRAGAAGRTQVQGAALLHARASWGFKVVPGLVAFGNTPLVLTVSDYRVLQISMTDFKL